MLLDPQCVTRNERHGVTQGSCASVAVSVGSPALFARLGPTCGTSLQASMESGALLRYGH